MEQASCSRVLEPAPSPASATSSRTPRLRLLSPEQRGSFELGCRGRGRAGGGSVARRVGLQKVYQRILRGAGVRRLGRGVVMVVMVVVRLRGSQLVLTDRAVAVGVELLEDRVGRRGIG